MAFELVLLNSGLSLLYISTFDINSRTAQHKASRWKFGARRIKESTSEKAARENTVAYRCGKARIEVAKEPIARQRSDKAEGEIERQSCRWSRPSIAVDTGHPFHIQVSVEYQPAAISICLLAVYPSLCEIWHDRPNPHSQRGWGFRSDFRCETEKFSEKHPHAMPTRAFHLLLARQYAPSSDGPTTAESCSSA